MLLFIMLYKVFLTAVKSVDETLEWDHSIIQVKAIEQILSFLLGGGGVLSYKLYGYVPR